MYTTAPIQPNDSLGDFCTRHRMSRELFFAINPGATQRAFRTEEGVTTLAPKIGEVFRVVDTAAMAARGAGPQVQPDADQLSVKAADTSSSEETKSGFSGWTVLFGVVVGTALGALGATYVVKDTFARGASVKDILKQWRNEGFGLAHEKYKTLDRDRRGRLSHVNGHEVVAQSGPVFAYEEAPGDYRAANIVTGHEWPIHYPSVKDLEAVFKYDIVPNLDHA